MADPLPRGTFGKTGVLAIALFAGVVLLGVALKLFHVF